jgi:tetratricopeptide (TPR) repeat protein
MTVRRSMQVVAVLTATLLLNPAAWAQQDGAPLVIPPGEPLGEAPAPAMNPAAQNDLGGYIKCMSIFAQKPGEEPAFDAATQEDGCTNVIELGSDIQRRDAYYARAIIRRLDDRKELALEDLNALMAIKPGDAFLLQVRGSLHGEMGNYDLASVDISQALKIAPMNASAHNSMCWMLAIEGKDLSRALNYCNISIGLTAGNGPALDSRGLVYLKMGKYDLALADYERAVRGQPDWAHFMYGRGIALLRLGREEEGRQWIALATAAEPDIAERYDDYGISQ